MDWQLFTQDRVALQPAELPFELLTNLKVRHPEVLDVLASSVPGELFVPLKVANNGEEVESPS